MGVRYFTLYTLKVFDKVRNNRVNKKVCLDASLSWTRQHRLSGALFPISPRRTQHRSLQCSPRYAACIVPELRQDLGASPGPPTLDAETTLTEEPSFSQLFSHLYLCAPGVLP